MNNNEQLLYYCFTEALKKCGLRPSSRARRGRKLRLLSPKACSQAKRSGAFGVFKAGVNLKAIFSPLQMGLMGISRSRFKQSKNTLLISRIYVMGCFLNVLVMSWYVWEEIVFLKGFVKFREIKSIEDLMKF